MSDKEILVAVENWNKRYNRIREYYIDNKEQLSAKNMIQCVKIMEELTIRILDACVGIWERNSNGEFLEMLDHDYGQNDN